MLVKTRLVGMTDASGLPNGLWLVVASHDTASMAFGPYRGRADANEARDLLCEAIDLIDSQPLAQFPTPKEAPMPVQEDVVPGIPPITPSEVIDMIRAAVIDNDSPPSEVSGVDDEDGFAVTEGHVMSNDMLIFDCEKQVVVTQKFRVTVKVEPVIEG